MAAVTCLVFGPAGFPFLGIEPKLHLAFLSEEVTNPLAIDGIVLAPVVLFAVDCLVDGLTSTWCFGLPGWFFLPLRESLLGLP